MIPISEAAKQVGKSVSAINKAIKSGRLSAEKNGNGQWVVQPSELFRLWKPSEQVSNGNNTSNNLNDVGINGLKREIELLRELINRADLENGRLVQQMETFRILADQRAEKPKNGFFKRLFS